MIAPHKDDYSYIPKSISQDDKDSVEEVSANHPLDSEDDFLGDMEEFDLTKRQKNAKDSAAVGI